MYMYGSVTQSVESVCSNFVVLIQIHVTITAILPNTVTLVIC